jgi:hypothetical protein
VAGEDDGLFAANVEEELQRCMPLLLFHIPVFSISFIVCIFVLLVLLLCTYFTVCRYYVSFYIVTYPHVNCILFAATLK